MRVVTKQGYEADDLLGTLAARARKKRTFTSACDRDKDALQLVDTGVEALITKRGITRIERYDHERIEDEMGIPPASLIDVKGLMGDASDNIPGVPGVGEKTALKLIAQFGSLEGVLENIGGVRGPKLKELLAKYSQQACMSKRLGEIDRRVDVDVALEDLRFAWPSAERIQDAFMRLELRSIYRRIAAKSPENGGEEKPLPAFAAKEVEVRDFDMLQSVVETARLSGKIAFTLRPELTLASGGAMYYRIANTHTLFEPGMDQLQVMTTLRLLIEDPAIEMVVYDLKSVLHALESWEIPLKGRCFDVMVAAYLLDPAQGGAAPEALAERYLGETAGHAAAVYALGAAMEEKLEAEGMAELFHEVEMPLVRVLYDMETLGFCVDTGMLAALDAEYAARLNALTGEIYALCGREFNINSPRQLGEVLFDVLGLPSGRKTKTGYSTDIEVLEGLASEHAAVPLIIEYRRVQKLKTTYTEGLLRAADPVTKRVHTSFKQTATATGRISSAEPNLQNIPVKTEMGRELRKAFVPGGHGQLLVGADYSQIELRLLSHIADDKEMQKAFLDGVDIHTVTASEAMNVPIDQVTPQMRSSAKAVNFGIIYGISEFSLAQDIGVTRAQAKAYMDAYFDHYQGVRRYMKQVISEAKENGYAETLMHRRRYLPELQSSNYNTRSFGERVALNMPIQGTAADLIKLSMVRVFDALQKQYPTARLVLQVHDELIVECDQEDGPGVLQLLKHEMEGVWTLCIPLSVDGGVRVGATWYDAK